MNIRTLTSVCAGLAVASGIVTVTLWRELHAERGVVAGLQAQLAEATRATTPAPAPRNDNTTAPAAAAAATVAQQEQPAAAPAAPRPRAPDAAQLAALTQEEMLKDPEYRKAMAGMMRSSMERTYPDLAEELGLEKEEFDRLLDLVAEQQTAMSAQARPFTAEMQRDQAAMEQMMREQQALRRKQDDAIRALLGEAKFAKWQEYQPTRSPRMQASNHANTLAQAGLPLSGAQVKSLTTVMIAEQKNMQQDLRAMSSRNAMERQSPEQMREAFANRQSDSNRRILEAAAPHLNAQQLNALRTQFEQQDAINRASARAGEAARQQRSGTIVTF
jgi:hypothetical protein